MVDVLRLHDIGEGDEAQTTHISAIESTVVPRGLLPIWMSDKLVRPHVSHRLTRASRPSRYRDRGRLMSRVHHDLHVVRVEMIVGDGERGCFQDGRDVIFRLDVGGDGRGRLRWEGRFLNIAFEYLRRCGRWNSR